MREADAVGALWSELSNPSGYRGFSRVIFRCLVTASFTPNFIVNLRFTPGRLKGNFSDPPLPQIATLNLSLYRTQGCHYAVGGLWSGLSNPNSLWVSWFFFYIMLRCYTPGRDGTQNAAQRPGSGGRPRGCGFEEQGGACARI